MSNQSNPFEDPEGTFLVLVNEEGQHSLWPSFVALPAGWTVALDANSRDACLEYVNANWTDMRPNSLSRTMDGAARPSQS